jgi:hypothetical protein
LYELQNIVKFYYLKLGVRSCFIKDWTGNIVFHLPSPVSHFASSFSQRSISPHLTLPSPRVTSGAGTAYSSGEPEFNQPDFFFDENIIFTLSGTGTEKNAYIRKVCIHFITMKKDNQSNNTNES